MRVGALTGVRGAVDPNLENYMSRALPAEVQLDADTAGGYLEALSGMLSGALAQEVAQPESQRLLSYAVPAMTEDGCSRIDGTLADEPYDLGQKLGISRAEAVSHPAVRRLLRIDGLVAKVAADTKLDWLGVYLARPGQGDEPPALVKLAYRGVESRAEFPLTREFARQSNNSAVGLSGRGVVINDIEQYLWTQGGPYYQCDSKVHSEACLPIYSPSGAEVAGILDAEAWSRDTFSEEVLSKLAAFCLVLQGELAALVSEL